MIWTELYDSWKLGPHKLKMGHVLKKIACVNIVFFQLGGRGLNQQMYFSNHTFSYFSTLPWLVLSVNFYYRKGLGLAKYKKWLSKQIQKKEMINLKLGFSWQQNPNYLGDYMYFNLFFYDYWYKRWLMFSTTLSN